MEQSTPVKKGVKSFSPMFWVVIMFEFFERGSYYGMMSILSVYFTDQLFFSKESVGIIKSTIQPILYFLPIIAGALADRFGYRRALLVAFSLLGGGYMLTSQMTSYTAVFLALVIMALGAGTFKPIISGTIARVTSKENSTLGFGIYYWSINLGAFLFPLFLVPYLKNNWGWHWVIIASAVGTGAMIIPTLLFYKEPPKPKTEKEEKQTNIIQTIANAFEIIYSPFILIYRHINDSVAKKAVIYTVSGILLILSLWLFIQYGNFLFLFIMMLYLTSLVILNIQSHVQKNNSGSLYQIIFAALITLFLWTVPGLSAFGRIVTNVIYLTVLSLFLIDFEDEQKFKDHFKFLLMIFIYSGFWILYFQMFDSVLWYVKDYVDAGSLNHFVNSLFAKIGITLNWHFDVEHVTVINAGTIIALQLIVSNIVKHTRALPTMISGILFGTIGMAILAISTSIWVFLVGIIIFSIGEMTAHPKFISYVGQTAPRNRVATYMGYIFLYGVIGSSIGGVLGANLYVHFVDNLNQPKILWLIFSGIGIATIIALLLYNKFLAVKEPAEAEV